MSHCIRILALAAEAFGGYGGIAQSTQDMLCAFSRATHTQIIILPRITKQAPGKLPPPIIQGGPRSGRIRYATQAATLAEHHRPHLIYCGHLYMAPLAAMLSRIVGAKLAVHVHGLEIWEPPTPICRWSLERADMVFCVSEDTARRVRQSSSVPTERVEVVLNAVRDQFYPRDRQIARQSFGLGSEKVLLTVSRLDGRQRHKGHDLVIPLLAGLNDISRTHNEPREVLYLIAGEGDDRQRLEALAETHNVVNRVRFLGRVPHARLPDLYSAADIYVMPSSGEGFGIAFAEAMSCGTPAIGLDLGGAPDALCHGILGTAVAPDTFADALRDLITLPSPERNQLSQATRTRFGRSVFEARISHCLQKLFPDATYA